MAEITIGNRKIGDGHPAYIIAEMSANHAGSIERAKEIIRAAKEAGADCIKIQTYTPDTLTIDCHNEYFSIENGLWEGENLYSLYSKAFTPWEWQEELKREAEKVGIDFFSTPFDKTAVDFLESIGVEFYKIASFELIDIPLIEYVASKGKPMILSTGMSTIEEIQDAINAIETQGNYQYAFLKCSSAYPAISAEMNLSTIMDMKKRFNVPIGLSDHSLGSIGAVTAVAIGANIIEKHFCISREIENPDAEFSMTKEEFKQMVTDIRDAERAKGVVKYGVSNQEKGNDIFRKSIFAVKDIKAGDILDETNIRVIRPGYGIKPKFMKDVLGKRAIKDIECGMPIRFDVFEEWIKVDIEEECDVLLLSNNDNALKLYERLKEKGLKVIGYSGKLDNDKLNIAKPKLIVSYNYKYIIEKPVIDAYKKSIVNLHVSYLPWNRGASPNFWSFYENTPKGVTIHYVDEGLDTGDVLLQRELRFNETQETFATTYKRLNDEIVNLFIENFDDILHKRIVAKKQDNNGTYHTKRMFEELDAKLHISWNENINDFRERIQGKGNI